MSGNNKDEVKTSEKKEASKKEVEKKYKVLKSIITSKGLIHGGVQSFKPSDVVDLVSQGKLKEL